MSPARSLEVAIVGMGCRTPGAPDLFAYWEQVLAGRGGASEPAAPGPVPVSEVIAAALADASLTPAAVEGPRIATLDALDRAMRALAAGEADLIIVAGEVTEADDRHPGAAALVLKRLADAERDGDRIYAVVQEVLETTSYGPSPMSPSPELAGLIQAALALYHRVRPPDLHAARPWIHADPDVPRRASVGAPGLAGPDTQIVLEEHSASADAEADAGNPGALLHWETEAILLSAPDRAGLADRARELVTWLDDHPRETLKDIAYTLNCGGEPDDAGARLGLVASSLDDLKYRLSALLPRLSDPSRPAIGDARGTYHWDEPLGGPGRLAFLFPGEGSQYPGMLADLCIHFPEIRRQFDIADRIARELGDAVLPSEHLSGPEGPAGLWSAPTAVNLILNAQWALYQVLTRLGLWPDAVAGHSSGEILALAAAGVLRADRELECQLGRLGAIFRGLESAGDMPAARLVAVAAERHRVEAVCRTVGADEVAVAIDNCPHQVVLAGPPYEVERVVGHLRADKVLVEILPIDRAYHTPGFAAVLGPIADSFAGLTFRAPELPVYSCATRERMPADPEAIRALAIAQWTRTVAFRETVEAMYADGLRLFIDVGARGNLAGFVQDILRGRPAFAIAANLPRRSGLTQANHLVAAIFAQGVAIRPGFLYARRRPRRIDWHEAERRARSLVETKVGFAGMSLTEPPTTRLSFESHLEAECDHPDRLKPGLQHSRSNGKSLGSPDVESPFSDRFSGCLAGLREPSEVDATMLAFQETMRAFLETQQAVIGTYLTSGPSPLGWVQPTGVSSGNPGGLHPPHPPDHLAMTTTSGAEPGPWLGELRRLVAGSEVEATYVLDARRDPIAEHHTLGGRRISALDPTLKGLPVLPFAVMSEMAAQAAALVVPPGLVLTALERVRAHKWVRYEESSISLELRGRRVASSTSPGERVRVEIFNRGRDALADETRPVFEAVAVFDVSVPAPPMSGPWDLEDARAGRFTAESIYADQWLFHGPALQAVARVGPVSASGIDGVLRVLPWEPLVERGRAARLHTDVIVIDSFTHLLGCWGLDELANRGDVIFPLHMEELQIYGKRPTVGTDVTCRIAIEEIQRHRVRVRAEIVRPDETVWMRIVDWEDWRFHWPSRYRDVFRQPQDIFIGEELLPGDPETSVVWLEPPSDMGRPVWRDVLEQTQLGPAERAEHLARGGPEEERSRRLWARIAAKEAARRLWRAEGRRPTYPADLAVVTDADGRGRPRLIRVDDPGDWTLPAIAISDADGVAVATAARDPRTLSGIAVAVIAARPSGLETIFTPGERAILARWSGPDSPEWVARFSCAKEAAARAAGTGLDGGPHATEVVRADEVTGVLHVSLASTITGALRVTTARRGEYAWARAQSGRGVES
jgi:malonyl CoA-acyl carrier protein transacylase